MCAGVKLPEASKMFGKRFACGSSVVKLPTGGEEINIQGTFMRVHGLEEALELKNGTLQEMLEMTWQSLCKKS